MSIYYNSYCPHCDHVLNRDMGISSKYSGSPIKTCSNCGKTYCDPRYFEPALLPYERRSIFSLIFRAVPLSFVIAVLSLGVVHLIPRLTNLLWPVTVAVFCASWLLLSIRAISKRSTLEEKRLKEWQESDQRLSDPNYAALLKSAHFDVPARYLPADFIPNTDSVPMKAKEKSYLASG